MKIFTNWIWTILLGLSFINGCTSNNMGTISPEPAVIATLQWQNASSQQQSYVNVRVPHYKTMTGYAMLNGRRYYGTTVLKSEAQKFYGDRMEVPLESIINGDMSLSDIYFIVDRVEPQLAMDIYLHTEVSCKIVISGFAGRLREKGTSRIYDGPFVFGPGTYRLETMQVR
ncbi:hypothetical protein ACFL02_06595 [Planctomycetota bacterium]